MKVAALLMGSMLVLCGCSSSEEAPTPPVALPSSSCPVVAPEDGIPAECVGGETGFDVTPAPVSTEGAPGSSAELPPVVLERLPRDLVVGGNDTDPAATSRTFAVTVPSGARLAATAACRGFAELTLETEPASRVELVLPCGQEQPIDLTVLEPELLEQDVTYQVTVEAPAPSRWYVALGAETEPAPAE